MRVYISADIEGVGGIAHLASTGPKRSDWETSARQWMTNEVLAAIAACDAAGANEYVITDGHGSAHNLLIDSFPDNSRLIRSWPRPLLQMEAIDQGHYDAAIFIGHHASATMAGGILAHSFTGTFADIRLNGVSQSETSLNVLLAGHYGVPVIFTSGDDCYIAHCQERLPGIETVITKRAIGYSSAESLTPAASCAAIRAGVARALERRASIAPLAQPSHFDLEMDFFSRSQPEMLDYLPFFERRGSFTIGLKVADAVEMMKTISFLSFYQSEGVPKYGF